MVDWIDIHFELSRRTQYWHLNDRIEKLTSRKEYPEALDLGEGKTATRYKLRVQEPNLDAVRKVLNDIESAYGFVAPAQISGIEISIDFYPAKPSKEARAQLHGVLVRHFYPTTRVLTGNLKWPRFTPGFVDKTGYTVSRNESDGSLDIGDRMTPGMDRPALSDSTYYVGERDDPRTFWRIQNKVFDKQNKAAGIRDELPEDKKRVRIEVTLGHVGCREIGLIKFSDLKILPSTRLQKGFFRFMKPTFAIVRPGGARPNSAAVKRKVEEFRRERFLNAGVLGLQIGEDAKHQLQALQMPRIRRWHRTRGSKMPSKVRTGAGPYGTMIAYKELTRVVERALAGLQRSVRGEMGV
ncbi:hypothetical protein QN219_00995 [Sinorhizobium sp. 7-81]|uniref:hypothetical protein n=1 Tax=Sinorhizobium sp. 8-89 TaxID=3049089 RepID=UPI0024C3EA0F|nr:hypothetical protein [Sinorhizobium sp. 8-89]MDK1488640.1 hypothetical protein [Sinorhizobium sp. 8-89]